ncbi:UTP--GlnB (protein PII) uridylyltransferase, GlnD [Desulfacinum hydrothermale DSM 13146]|uniref:Bifunctional uridylyltransferase/uridylyl-removing enzyme n=1 Tax=Desulfacinum hydrothermale DSM 13146 TaxID=1121390 RepID=A0A1W1XUW5_9BACT|nr:[protein-PII] uridylyltransferase [Desulfacinum hydrothermale]SMC27743.1 UTP--GlnB (protein PII) uridylyltransferase, GlnD [Desulfacinum hydrothermale DSM 13146]
MDLNASAAVFSRLRSLREEFAGLCHRDVPGVTAAQTYALRVLEALKDAVGPRVQSSEGWFLAAVGGLGRGQLSFVSDLDLLFLYKRRLPRRMEAVVRDVVYGLWDCQFEVGHGTLSRTALKRLMAEDFSAQTTNLEARFIAGDAAFFDAWRDDLLGSFGVRKRSRFLERLREFRARRADQYGESTYLLEPHVKEGPGGLRDLQAIRWIGMVFLGNPGLDRMVGEGWLSSEEALWLEKAEDFLWRVRLQLHQANGRRQDQLLLADQEDLAYRLGFLDGSEGSAVEAFMRLYYRHTARVRRIAAFLVDRLEHDKERRSRRRRRKKILPGPLLLEGDHLFFVEPERIPQDPGIMMTLFWEAARNDAHFHHRTGQIVRRNLPHVTDALRTDPDVVERFFSILLHPRKAFAILKVMMETGFLQTFLPELAPVRYRVQHDVYHLYTVDEHLLRTVLELHRLEADQESLAPQVRLAPLFSQIRHKRVLYLAGLVHDMGKGAGKNHSVRGAHMCRDLAVRLGLDAEERDLLEFLVRHHLLLAETALKRDLSDEKPILRCAMRVADRERLRLLYLLTVADSRATGPGAWNTWRASLLHELFVKVDRALERGDWKPEDAQARAEAVQRAVLERCDQALRARMERWLDSLSLRYLLSQDPEDILRHFHMEARVPEEPLVLQARPLEEELWQVTVACPDRPGLFATITGVLWLHGCNILSADIFTRARGIALDVLTVENIPDPLHPDEVWQGVSRDLELCVENPDRLQALVERYQPRIPRKKAAVPRKKDRVVLDESASDFYTVIEVYTWDRPGVLHAVTRTLFELGITIQLAKISTPGAQVVDVFYVTNLEGEKILDPERHQEIEARLLDCLVQWPMV